MISIEKELAALSNNFTEPRVAVKCWTFDEKEAAVKIFNKYFVVNVERLSDSIFLFIFMLKL